ncbi:uncharacterized protein BP5553_06004 [Venustampulla echinocandica]|uniref:Copper transport protein n=1 Tax=Venustampulla echinocandica TaxID=2656787 RepID=A0A370TMA9_9HELO|nr:uncharacterized protein BP5553_06004 [Venustampulla echinocandica]RDL36652.1 hypothetical protein BP5553_06004 [Venustampulla echinocandica]
MDMDMGTMSMTPSTTAVGAAQTTTSSLMASSTAMSGMDMADSCKISSTLVRFISRTWHIKSKGMFAGACIGVILLVMSLEFLRRLSKEYDRYILRKFQKAQPYLSVPGLPHGKAAAAACKSSNPQPSSLENFTAVSVVSFRPGVFQQAIRATLHMLQFAVAYFIMLLAMYYNGYIIISIIIGAWLGGFVFSWEAINTSGPQEEATVCCG